MRSEGHGLFSKNCHLQFEKVGVAQESWQTGLFGNGATGFGTALLTVRMAMLAIVWIRCDV